MAEDSSGGMGGQRMGHINFMMTARDDAMRQGDLGIWYTSAFLFNQVFGGIEKEYKTFMDNFKYKKEELARNYYKDGKLADPDGYTNFVRVCERIEDLHIGRKGELDVVTHSMSDKQAIPEIIECNLSLSQLKPLNYSVVRKQMPGIDMIEEVEKIPSKLVVPGFRMNVIQCDHFLDTEGCPLKGEVPNFNPAKRKELLGKCSECFLRQDKSIFIEQVYVKNLRQAFHESIMSFIRNEFTTYMGAFNELANVQAKSKRHMQPLSQDKDYALKGENIFVKKGSATADPNVKWQEDLRLKGWEDSDDGTETVEPV